MSVTNFFRLCQTAPSYFPAPTQEYKHTDTRTVGSEMTRDERNKTGSGSSRGVFLSFSFFLRRRRVSYPVVHFDILSCRTTLPIMLQ